ncbi:hypothetical protein VULLAG_LOCUS21926 [Vulpes lagopus]
MLVEYGTGWVLEHCVEGGLVWYELEITDKVKCEASAERRSWLSWDVQEVWEVRPDIVLKMIILRAKCQIQTLAHLGGQRTIRI